MTATIALVDDDRNILQSLSIALQAEGFVTRVYSDGEAALKPLIDNPPDLAVFDIKMPRMDGLELLRRLREKSQLPVIFLTSKDDEIDEALGLAMGADDYIAKPFSQRLVIARIRAILRRVELNQNAPAADDEPVAEPINRGRLTMDPARHKVAWDGKDVTLTVTEFLILETLAARPGIVRSRNQLMDAAYQDDVYIDDRTIDSHIKRLRRKFREVDPEFDAIATLYGRVTDLPTMAEPLKPDASIAEQEESPLVWSARWSLTTRILAVNILAVALLAGGFYYLDTYRSRLVDTRIEVMKDQLAMLDRALEAARPDQRATLIDEFAAATESRLRFYDADGRRISDSFATGPATYTLRDPNLQGVAARRGTRDGPRHRLDRRRALLSRFSGTRGRSRRILARSRRGAAQRTGREPFPLRPRTHALAQRGAGRRAGGAADGADDAERARHHADGARGAAAASAWWWRSRWC